MDEITFGKLNKEYKSNLYHCFCIILLTLLEHKLLMNWKLLALYLCSYYFYCKGMSQEDLHSVLVLINLSLNYI